MSDLLQLLISGTATGATYALAALGFTLLWQASGTINFAQGEFVMVPAFLMLFALGLGLPLLPAFLLASLGSAILLGWGFKRAIVDPLRKHQGYSLVIATMGLSIGVKQLMKAGYSAEAHSFPNLFPEALIAFGTVRISWTDIGTLAVAVLIVGGLQIFLGRTLTGRAMQACAQNSEGAAVLGIRVNRMILYTFVINALLGAVAAILVTPTYLAKFDMGDSIGGKAFFAAIIGGFNQMRGALLGGVLIGVLENLTGHFVSPAYKESVVLMLFLVVILFRPEGLLGKAEERKV
jgi:branched-chain amino acid transport system permease protein